MESGRPIANVEFDLQMSDGRRIPVVGNVAPLFENGAVRGCIAAFMDISERRKAEIALREITKDVRAANEALVQSNEDLERFAYVASHDLQEPLRLISIYAELLVGKHNVPADDPLLFERTILEGTARMRELIADLLAYTRIRIAVQEIEGELQFSVTDNGIGIDPKYHTDVFVAFKRLHSGLIPGTGIGSVLRSANAWSSATAAACGWSLRSDRGRRFASLCRTLRSLPRSSEPRTLRAANFTRRLSTVHVDRAAVVFGRHD
jgi:signal transduction histidine kinase